MNSIHVSEIFGPTFQGEGPDVGRRCVFLRLAGCPVLCRGCDTPYALASANPNNSSHTPEQLVPLLRHARQAAPGDCGLVVTGGEPLQLLAGLNSAPLQSLCRYLTGGPVPWSWLGLETSGYADRWETTFASKGCVDFLSAFDTIVISPKVTPCLLGEVSREQFVASVGLLIRRAFEMSYWARYRIALKFVAEREEDLEAVETFLSALWSTCSRADLLRLRVFIMPLGTGADTLTVAQRLAPAVLECGWSLSPRWHAMLWGAKRGV